MNSDFMVYLKEIGMTDILINRVEDIYKFYQVVSPNEIIDIFVTDFIKEDTSREYENLWLFTDRYMMEAKGFIILDDFDMTLMRKQITYWKVEKQDYDFQTSTDKSRLHISIQFTYPTFGEFKASKENCDYLKKIFHKFILPNFIG